MTDAGQRLKGVMQNHLDEQIQINRTQLKTINHADHEKAKTIA